MPTSRRGELPAGCSLRWVSWHSPLGEGRTSAQEPRQAEGGEVPYPTLALSRLSQKSVAKCRKLSQSVVSSRPLPAVPFWISPIHRWELYTKPYSDTSNFFNLFEWSPEGFFAKGFLVAKCREVAQLSTTVLGNAETLR